MTFRFLRKRWSSGSSEKFQYELDKSRSNKNVLKIEDKQTVTYIVNPGTPNNTPGTKNFDIYYLAKANHPLSSSVPLSYFEVFILNGGKEGSTTSTIAVGLATHEYSTDLFPGWIRGSYGYHGDDGRKYSGLPGGTGEPYGPTFGPGDVIGVGLDNASNNIFFTKNGRYLGPAYKRTGVADLYPCVGLSTPGETACVNFVPPFVFDHVAAQTGGIGANPSSMEEVGKGKGYEDLHWDPQRCGKSLEITQKIRAQVVADAPHSAIGVVQCSLPFSPYHSETFSYFEVYIDKLEKGHVSIGLSNHEYPLNLHIGWLRRSYGYHSDDGRKFKWKEHESGTNDGELYGPSFGQGDVIGCGLNLQTRELYFTKNGSVLGVAFTNVYGILYPSVALTGPGDAMTANFYPPFKCSLFTNSLVNLSTGSSTGSNSSTTIVPPPPPLPGHAQLSVSAPAIRNIPSSGITGNGTSPTISESPPRAPSFLHGHSSANTYPSHITRSPQPTHVPPSSTSPLSVLSNPSSTNSIPNPSASVLGSSPSQRANSLMISKSTPTFSGTSLPSTTTISATLTNLQRSTGSKSNTSSSESQLPFTILPSSTLSLSNTQLSNPTGSASPSPPVSPRGLSASNSSVPDDAHCNPGPTPAPTPVISQPSLNSSGGALPASSGSGWRKCGKTIKLKDEITATLAKKKTGMVQGAQRCSSVQRLWYFEVYIEGMDKRASVCVGLTCEDYSLNKHIGREAKSFGYFSEDGRKCKNGEANTEPYGKPYLSGEVIGCGFNTVTREIFFTRNGNYLGVAFWDIPEMPLYPSVSLRGVVGLTCVATFHAPFKFDLHALPDISPSMWSESLGDPTLSDEQVIYPPSSSSSSSSRMNWDQSSGSSNNRELRGLFKWPANDVAIWLESIGYGQYRKQFYNNNISGRHLHDLSHQLLKNELGIESYGHRADILDRVNKLLITWKEKVGTEDSINSSLMDSTDTGGSGGSEFSEFPQEHANGANLIDPHNEDILQPYRPPLLHHPQAVHRMSDHENSEDEARGARGKRNINTPPSQAHPHPHPHTTPHANTIANLNTSSTNAGINPNLVSLLNGTEKDSKWRRRTVPCPDVEVRDDSRATPTPTPPTPTPPATNTTPQPIHGHYPAHLNHRNNASRPRTNTGNLPLPSASVFDTTEALSNMSFQDLNNTSGHNHKPKPMPFQNHSQLANSTLSSSPPVVLNSTQPLMHLSPVSHMSNSLNSLPTFVSTPTNPNSLIPSPISLTHSNSSSGISQTTPPPRSGSPLTRTLHTPPPIPPTQSTPVTSPEPQPTQPHQTSTPVGGQQLTVATSTPASVSPTKTSGEIPVEQHEWEIDFKELELGAVIGKGFFGEVKRGSWRETDVAIKIIYRDSFKSKNSFDMFMNEVSILSKLRHPCVVQFLGACTTGDTHCIVTEWMVGGSLRNFLNSYFHAITPLIRIKIGLDIAKGMNYLHGWTPPILHRDLSTRNILLDVDSVWSSSSLSSSLSSSNLSISSPAQPIRPSSVRCKVADFGLSRLKLEHGVMTASVGCIPYMAPEVYKGEANSEKSDVYSYGMILWEVLTGEEPQQDMKPLKMAHLAAHEGYRPPLVISTHPAWRTLITQCWGTDADARPSFKQIIISLKDMEEKEKASLAAMRLSASVSSSSSTSSNFLLNSANTSATSLVFPTAPPPVSRPTIPSPRNIGEYTD